MLVIFSRPVVKVLKIDLGRSLKFTKLHGILETFKNSYIHAFWLKNSMVYGRQLFLLNNSKKQQLVTS